jgi:uncharacterized protein YlaN (UPF0358 family)
MESSKKALCPAVEEVAENGQYSDSIAVDLARKALDLVAAKNGEDLINWTDTSWSQWRDHHDGSVW